MWLKDFKTEIIQDEYACLDSSWRSKNVCDHFTRLYFVRYGSGYLHYVGKEVILKPGNVYIVPAELNFEYGCHDGETMEKIFFHISMMTFENYDILSNTKEIYSLSLEQAGCEDIFEEYEKKDYLSMIKVHSMVYNTLSTFLSTYKFDVFSFNEYSMLVKNIMKCVSKNTRINLTADEISKELFVSKSKLRNAFREEVGITLGKYIDDMVFYRAKSFLGNKSMAMSEISSRLGFCDQFYFSRRFKEKYGKTPSQYRREMTT